MYTQQECSGLLQVTRIQNPILYRQYMMKQHHMDKVNTQQYGNEKILYHGTSADTQKEIETSGFNRSYCGKNGVKGCQGFFCNN